MPDSLCYPAFFCKRFDVLGWLFLHCVFMQGYPPQMAVPNRWPGRLKAHLASLIFVVNPASFLLYFPDNKIEERSWKNNLFYTC